MKSSVDKFNHIVGNSPKGYDGTPDEVWEQIELQASLVLEEAKEMYEAAKNRDMVEVLDGHLDVRYTNTYMNTLLEACGVDTAQGKEEVVGNNEMKYTTNIYLALENSDEYNAKGIPTEVKESEVEGEFYYCVKRASDGKVMKLSWHVDPDLESCVPDKWKEK